MTYMFSNGFYLSDTRSCRIVTVIGWLARDEFHFGEFNIRFCLSGLSTVTLT